MISFISRPTYRSWSGPRSGSRHRGRCKATWASWVVAQLGAKVLHVAVDGALVTLKVVAEHLLDQLHAVVDAAGVTGKRGEQLELGGRQVDFLALDQHLVARDVNDQIAKVEHLNGGLIGLVTRRNRARTRATSSRGENGLIR